MKQEWAIMRLGDAATFINGYPFKPSDWSNIGLPIIRIQNLTESSQNINYYAGQIDKQYLIQDGDVLISWSASLGVYEWKNGNAWLNQHIFKVKFDKIPFEKSFFKYVISAKLDHMSSVAHGATMKHITKKNFDEITIPYPPLLEQRRLAEILSTVNLLIEQRKHQIEKLDLLAKSRFIEMFGDSKAKFQRLGDICSVGSSKRVFVEELQTKGIPFFRGTEVGRLAEDKDIEPTLFITEEHYIALCKHTGKPKIGDLLLPSICPDGRVWCVNSERPFYFKDGRVLWVKVPDAINGCYLRFALSQSIIENYSTLASGITFAELKIVTLKEAPIPLPPLALQNEFAAFIEQLDKSKFSVSQQQKTIDSYQRGIILQLAGGE